eukprot:g18501.t1
MIPKRCSRRRWQWSPRCAAKAFRAELVKQGVLEEPKPVDPNFTSEVPGVCWDKASKKWQVLLTPNKATKGPNKRIHGGFFTEKAAAESKALELAKLHGLERKVTAVGRFSELPIFGAKVPYPGVTWERRSQKWHARCRSFRAKPKDHSEAELEASHKKAVVWRKKQEKERVKAAKPMRSEDSTEVVNVMLAADTSGRLLSRSNRQNQSALHLAVILGASNSVRLLVAKGAATDLKDAEGLTPLDYAKRRNDVEAVQSITAGEALVAAEEASEDGAGPPTGGWNDEWKKKHCKFRKKCIMYSTRDSREPAASRAVRRGARPTSWRLGGRMWKKASLRRGSAPS